MIIITTVGRTGSSALMEYLKRLKVNVGELPWHRYYEAGNEHPSVVKINSEFRKKVLSKVPMRDFKLYMEIDAIKLSAVKDPQFLVIPEIIEHWWYVRKDIKVILLERKPEDIVKSLRRKPIMNSPVYRNHTDLIAGHLAQFKKTLKENNIPYVTYTFPDFIDEHEKVNKQLEEWGIKGDQKIWEETFSKKKVHFT